ncbi:hypothetical protein BDN70DRAFT_894672 [Pholiota conissans]|uniref:Rab-GAP TBC domain-containing protein n=1 Tax=Pholiota conissans TaxID=109636 RepID=A0A9P5Z2Z7_9AGAR|nr:hypothetical protein BDN70DRAFT_894672 [Pholiota conissans]
MLSEEPLLSTETISKPSTIDWNALRAKSLQHGGFGEERLELWPQVLHVSIRKSAKEEELSRIVSEPHADEHQIGLDTDRSFVLYPVESKIDKETLKTSLNSLLVSLFRKRPRLSYFQGYHDIVTVLYLTLPEELQLPCVEKLSLHRLRDSMGLGLEPVLGLLRVTKNLLELADPEYAGILEQSSPLPFYALSNLLTLFSHDMPTLPLIQHVFDYLLCRPPIASVYLATAIILARKKEVLRLQEEDEDGMIHSLLSSIPYLVDSSVETEIIGLAETSFINKSEDFPENVDNTFFKEEDGRFSLTIPTALKEEVKQEQNEEVVLDSVTLILDERTSAAGDEVLSEPLESAIRPVDISAPSIGLPSESEARRFDPEGEQCAIVDSTKSEVLLDTDPTPVIDPVKAEEPKPIPVYPKLTLIDLLNEADALYGKFPPSHSGLRLSSIMGPQSVVFTWSESPSALSSDRTAEAMVAHPELVVYPYVEPDFDQKEKTGQSAKDGHKPTRRKRRKLRKSPFGQMEKKTMLAGTVIVLGVAMAVYGIKARHAAGGHGLFHYADGHVHGNNKDWKRIGGWFGGALAGMSQKIMNGISSAP